MFPQCFPAELEWRDSGKEREFYIKKTVTSEDTLIWLICLTQADQVRYLHKPNIHFHTFLQGQRTVGLVV